MNDSGIQEDVIDAPGHRATFTATMFRCRRQGKRMTRLKINFNGIDLGWRKYSARSS
jgi:hypothetical protein